MDCQNIIGGRLILVECEDTPNLINFYESNLFENIPLETDLYSLVDNLLTAMPTKLRDELTTKHYCQDKLLTTAS